MGSIARFEQPKLNNRTSPLKSHWAFEGPSCTVSDLLAVVFGFARCCCGYLIACVKVSGWKQEPDWRQRLLLWHCRVIPPDNSASHLCQNEKNTIGGMNVRNECQWMSRKDSENKKRTIAFEVNWGSQKDLSGDLFLLNFKSTNIVTALWICWSLNSWLIVFHSMSIN